MLIVDRNPIAVAVCTECETWMHWIESPTGGWWVHDEHPEDDHDGIAPVPDSVRQSYEDRDASEVDEFPCPACGVPLDGDGKCNNPDCDS